MKAVPWVKTGNANMPRVAYVAEDHEMWVAFASGNAYRFEGVPKRYYSDLLKATDKVRYFRAHLMARFEFERMRVR